MGFINASLMPVSASLSQVNKREVVVGDSTVVGALALHATDLGLIPNTIYSPSNNRSEHSARNQPLSTAGSAQNSTESVVVLLTYKELLY